MKGLKGRYLIDYKGKSEHLPLINDIYFHKDVYPKKGDVIIEGGLYVADSLIQFYDKTEGCCEIHAFEIDEENIILANKNIELNKLNKNVIKINNLGLASESSIKSLVNSVKNSSNLSEPSDDKGENKIKTISLDDYVKFNSLNKVYFIKLDIESFEVPAIEGVSKTIRKFKPKLAICIYHLWTDSFLIPELILKLNPNYKIYFKWVQPVKDLPYEAVLFAVDSTEEINYNISRKLEYEELVKNYFFLLSVIPAQNIKMLNGSKW